MDADTVGTQDPRDFRSWSRQEPRRPAVDRAALPPGRSGWPVVVSPPVTHRDTRHTAEMEPHTTLGPRDGTSGTWKRQNGRTP